MMSGNWAIGSACMATRPPNMVMIAMTMATIGRRMKNLDIGSVPLAWRGEWLGIHDRAIGGARAFHHHTRARLEAPRAVPAGAPAGGGPYPPLAVFFLGAR